MSDELPPLRDHLTRWGGGVFAGSGRLHRSDDDLGIGRTLAIGGVLQQSAFFRERIVPLMEKTTERIFVIISDALRYEAGAELFEKLGRRLNAEVSLEPMQATLPSYTRLGMGAFLRGKVTRIDGQGTVYVEELPGTGVNTREKMLQQAVSDGAAFRLDDWIQLGKEKGLKAIRGRRVIYLYHNRIDATGDQQVTETYTFDDVQQAIEELERVVGKLTGT